MQYEWIFGGIVVIFISSVAIFILFYKTLKAERAIIEAKSREQALLSRNESLYHMSQMKTEFFQNLSHDFKTPLTVISTGILNIEDMLSFDNIDKQEILECLNNSQREIMRMSRMIDSAMNISSVNDSYQGKELLDIANILREGAETYRAFLKRRGNVLQVSIPKTLPKVCINLDMLLHVLANLFSNANRHTQNGKIYISARKTNDSVVISITDNGVGISPELIPHIFERGVTENGTGIGLSICKSGIEEVHNGKISIESKKGSHTQVTFELPIFKEEGEISPCI